MSLFQDALRKTQQLGRDGEASKIAAGRVNLRYPQTAAGPHESVDETAGTVIDTHVDALTETPANVPVNTSADAVAAELPDAGVGEVEFSLPAETLDPSVDDDTQPQVANEPAENPHHWTGADDTLQLQPVDTATVVTDNSGISPSAASQAMPATKDLACASSHSAVSSSPEEAAAAPGEGLAPEPEGTVLPGKINPLHYLDPMLIFIGVLFLIGLLGAIYWLLVTSQQDFAVQRQDYFRQAADYQNQLQTQPPLLVNDPEPDGGSAAFVPGTDSENEWVQNNGTAARDLNVESAAQVDDQLRALQDEVASLHIRVDQQQSELQELSEQNQRLQTALANSAESTSTGTTLATAVKKTDPPVAQTQVSLVQVQRTAPVASNPVSPGRPATSVASRGQGRDLIRRGFAAYQAQDYATAETNYQQALALQPLDRDANLGVAALARLRGDYDQAEQRYRHLLSVDAEDSAAFTGLLSLSAEAGNSAIEQELLSLASGARSAGRMYAVLGNHYSQSQRWHEAKDAWAQALQRDQSNPDYAYNLAVSLDHLAQGSAAAEQYQRALDYSAQRSFHFNQADIQQRLIALQAAR